jgi:hypothetical protein
MIFYKGVAVMEYKETIEHFSEELSEDIQQYATEDILKFSRYIFTRRQGKQQYGYCTHCKKEFKTNGIRHNDKESCPKCESVCIVKASGRGRRRMWDTAYFVYYEKSIIDSNVIVARGIEATRDYRGDYHNVNTKYWVRALYVFEMGNSIMMTDSYWYDTRSYKFNKSKSVYSLFSQYHNDGWLRKDVYTDYSLESIQKAVKDTPFQYSCWEEYTSYSDMVKFFDLYSRYPCIEYLTKLGMENIVEAKLIGNATYSAINWNGKSLPKVLRLSKKDINEIKTVQNSIDPLFLRLFQISKKDNSCLSFEKISKISREYAYYFKDLQKVLKYTNLKKAHNYIHKQYQQESDGKKQYYSSDRVLNTWKDYIVDCESLLMNLSDDRILYPKNLLKAHQETTKRIKSDGNKLMDTLIEKRIDSLKLYCFEYQGLMIRPAESTKELIDEGKELNICVGNYANGYMTKYSKGQTNLLLIRKISEPNKPYYTMELCKGQIKQVQGKNHCNPDKIVSEFVEAFTEQRLREKKTKVAKSA